MKKYIYCSLALLAVMVASCTDFDEPVTEVYAPGPGVTVEVKAVSDSTVTYALTIDTVNTKYYAISFATSAKTPDSLALLKTAAGGDAKLFNAKGKDNKWDANGTQTFTYTKLNPNTDYYFYAVASSTTGMVGSVSGVKATTTDGLSPQIKAKGIQSDTIGLSVTFTEPMKLGKGKITAQYFAPYDETLALKDVDSLIVDIDGATVLFKAVDVPAGAYVIVSWEAGALTDMFGNSADAVTTSFDDDLASDCYYATANSSFEISEENLTDSVGVFADYTTYKVEFKFDFPVFARALDGPKDEYEDIIATIYAADYTMVVDGVSAKWSVKDSSLFVLFPKDAPEGAYVSLDIPANLIVDIYGNPNTEVSIDKYWAKEITRATILGSYIWAYVNPKGKPVYDTISITADPSAGDGVLINDLALEGSQIGAQLTNNKLIIPDMQVLGILPVNDTVSYYVVNSTYDLAEITFEFLPDLSAISYSDESEEGIVWYVQLLDAEYEYVGAYTYADGDVYLIPIE